MNKTFVVAPLLFVAYGVVRWIDGADGAYGPGPAWTTGHLLFLAAFPLWAATLIQLRRSVPRARRAATVAAVAGLVGVLVFVRGIVIDLVVGFRATDHADMSRVADGYHRWPGDVGVYGPLHEIGPILLVLGLSALTVLLAVGGRLPTWSPFVLLAGFAAIVVDLNLMPLGGALLLAALLPQRHRPVSDRAHQMSHPPTVPPSTDRRNGRSTIQ